MRAIMQVVHPKQCERIGKGEQLMLLSKTKPKDVELSYGPFKVYIYCACKIQMVKCGPFRADRNGLYKYKDSDKIYGYGLDAPFRAWADGDSIEKMNGSVIGEFIVEKVDHFVTEFYPDDNTYQDIRVQWPDDDSDDVEAYNEMVVASNENDNPSDNWLCKKAHHTFEEIKEFAGYGRGEFWGFHISQMRLYDHPKGMYEFFKPCGKCSKKGTTACVDEISACRAIKCTRPPRGWMFVEEATC